LGDAGPTRHERHRDDRRLSRCRSACFTVGSHVKRRGLGQRSAPTGPRRDGNGPRPGKTPNEWNIGVAIDPPNFHSVRSAMARGQTPLRLVEGLPGRNSRHADSRPTRFLPRRGSSGLPLGVRPSRGWLRLRVHQRPGDPSPGRGSLVVSRCSAVVSAASVWALLGLRPHNGRSRVRADQELRSVWAPVPMVEGG
jgi:hypothetical protein